LTGAILAALGEPSVEQVLHRRTMRGPGRLRSPEGLAPVLLDVAEAGDPVAREIVIGHGRSLGRTALAAAKRVGIEHEAFPLALTGGVLRHPGRLLEAAIVDEVRSGAPRVHPTRPTLEPAVGALLLAFDEARIRVDERIAERILQTLPPADTFDTHPLVRAAR
jgi:N-acetylglucosamine kinase-like BadF-type ATPase